MSKFNKTVKKPCLNRSSSHSFKHWEVIKTNIKTDCDNACDDLLKNSVALVLEDDVLKKDDVVDVVDAVENIKNAEIDDIDYKELFKVNDNCFSINNPTLEKNIIVYENEKTEDVQEEKIEEEKEEEIVEEIEEFKEEKINQDNNIEDKIKLITKPKSLIDVVMALQREALREKLNREALINKI